MYSPSLVFCFFGTGGKKWITVEIPAQQRLSEGAHVGCQTVVGSFSATLCTSAYPWMRSLHSSHKLLHYYFLKEAMQFFRHCWFVHRLVTCKIYSMVCRGHIVPGPNFTEFYFWQTCWFCCFFWGAIVSVLLAILVISTISWFSAATGMSSNLCDWMFLNLLMSLNICNLVLGVRLSSAKSRP